MTRMDLPFLAFLAVLFLLPVVFGFQGALAVMLAAAAFVAVAVPAAFVGVSVYRMVR